MKNTVKKFITVVTAASIAVASVYAPFQADAATKIAKPSVTVKRNTSTGYVTVKIKKVKNATGYQIAFRKNSNTKWSVAKTKKLTKTYKVSKQTVCRIKVRAYKKSKKKTVYGKWSAVKTVKKYTVPQPPIVTPTNRPSNTSAHTPTVTPIKTPPVRQTQTPAATKTPTPYRILFDSLCSIPDKTPVAPSARPVAMPSSTPDAEGHMHEWEPVRGNALDIRVYMKGYPYLDVTNWGKHSFGYPYQSGIDRYHLFDVKHAVDESRDSEGGCQGLFRIDEETGMPYTSATDTVNETRVIKTTLGWKCGCGAEKDLDGTEGHIHSWYFSDEGLGGVERDGKAICRNLVCPNCKHGGNGIWSKINGEYELNDSCDWCGMDIDKTDLDTYGCGEVREAAKVRASINATAHQHSHTYEPVYETVTIDKAYDEEVVKCYGYRMATNEYMNGYPYFNITGWDSPLYYEDWMKKDEFQPCHGWWDCYADNRYDVNNKKIGEGPVKRWYEDNVWHLPDNPDELDEYNHYYAYYETIHHKPGTEERLIGFRCTGDINEGEPCNKMQYVDERMCIIKGYKVIQPTFLQHHYDINHKVITINDVLKKQNAK